MSTTDRPLRENAAEFDPAADRVFDRIASRYDILCDIFSLGLHRLWKRRMARMIAQHDWHCMLDAASGTGHIVMRLLRTQPGIAERRRIILADLSAPMLAISQRDTRPLTHALDYRILDAQSMPGVADNSIDLYSISLALKICDRARVMQEAFRVLKPGGRFIALEASAIVMSGLHYLYLAYMNVCMPLIGRLATGGDASAYLYLLRGIRDFPDAERLADELRAIGFDDVKFERLSLGIVAIHSARKP